MAFQTPISVSEAVENIRRGKYLLPAIQREFVWKPDQIIRLFDSLMKDYPIGSFLFWDVAPEKVKEYQFYRFIQDYHERDRKHNVKAQPSREQDVVAVLDGQQRLTSLYIALKGSYAAKKRYYHWSSDHAFPVRRLYLNLTQPSDDFDLEYDFRFREEEEDVIQDKDGTWMRLNRALDYNNLTDVFNFLRDYDLLNERQFPQDALTSLHEAVNSRGVVSAYMEKDQDLNKVLNIFIRVNSAGTVLSYSDLLLSIATAQWKTLDAREEIYSFVEEVNDIGRGFSFGKDFVLKTSLMLAGLDTRWTVSNFTRENMEEIESMWPEIKKSIQITVRLINNFGFSGGNLPSENAIIPIAYYMAQSGVPSNFAESKYHAEERKRIKHWLHVALLKRTFTGQPDPILRTCRETIDEYGDDGFPDEKIVQAMKQTPQSMRFDEEELGALLENKYGKTYTFVVLSMLYPWLDFDGTLQQDHIHPKKSFHKSHLQSEGVTDPIEIDAFKEHRDQIPNLQLIQGISNSEKSGTPFDKWIQEKYPDPEKRSHYMRQNYIPEDVDFSIAEFRTFFKKRRDLMLRALKDAIGWRKVVGSSKDRPVSEEEEYTW